MPFSFQGVDPSSRMKGAAAWGNLQGVLGDRLTPQHQQQAMSFLGYTDPTGETEISGSDFNRLQEEAAKMFGGTFTPWSQPNQGGGGMDLPWNANQGEWGSHLQLPNAFKAKPFVAPTMAEALNDPGYQLALNESQGAIENSASARGAVFHPNTMRSLVDDARKRASDQYDKVYGRRLAEAGFEREGELAGYDRGVDAGVLRGTAYATDRQFDADQYYRWADFNNRVKEFQSSDQFRRYVYGTDDEYRRWRDSVGDEWKRIVMDEERARFLAELGAR